MSLAASGEGDGSRRVGLARIADVLIRYRVELDKRELPHDAAQGGFVRIARIR